MDEVLKTVGGIMQHLAVWRRYLGRPWRMRGVVDGAELSANRRIPDAERVSISVVIPAYNEERIIEETLNAVLGHLARSGETFEVIVVDDGSRDSTADKVDSLVRLGSPIVLLRNEANRGKGYAVRRGMLNARGRYLFFMDADFSYPVQELDKMLRELRHGYDLAIGSRALPESSMEVRPPLLRYVAGQVYAFLIGALVFGGMADTQCGFKGFRAEVARDLFSRVTLSDFAFDVEVLFLARKHGYKVAMVPVSLRFNSGNSKVRIVRDSLSMFFDLFRIRWNDAKGRYDL
jgi:dolichyl-phosphate beta-glucosyltransferase